MTTGARGIEAATIGAIILAALVLTWIFWRANALSPQEHIEYETLIRQARQADTELNAAILANRMSLLANFDPLVAEVGALRHLTAHLTSPPRFLDAPSHRDISLKAQKLKQMEEEKAQLVDRYQREISALRNSLQYYPQAASTVLDRAGGTLNPRFDRFHRHLLTLVQTPDQARAEAVERERLQLAQYLVDNVPTTEEFDNLLMHARIIIARQPVVEQLTRDILNLPTIAVEKEIERLYADGYERAAARASAFRTALYVIALLLAAYLAYNYVSLTRARSALANAHDDLAAQLDVQKRAEEQTRLYATVFTSAAEGMVITDNKNHIVAVNPAFTMITGFSVDEVVGKTPEVLRSGRHDTHYYRQMWGQLDSQNFWRGEIWNRRKNGEIFPEWLSITVVRDGNGTPSNYIGIFSDVSERKESEARIHHLAHHDALTDLPNRILLHDRLDQAILQSKRGNRRTAVLFLDLDRFKNINDSLGHDVGDSLLVQVADRCASLLRETDTISRQGGDEFVIVLPELEESQDAAQVARKLTRALDQPFLLGGHELTVTGSIGIALYPEDGGTASELLKNADAAMYRTKAEGRNGFQFYSADMNIVSLGDLLLESQLRGAIERGELMLYFQPKVDAISLAVTGLEALLRWQHPERGLLQPKSFVAVAEECGLIMPIGEWVLRRVCYQLRTWMDAGLPIVPVSINISAHQFAHQELISLTDSALRENRLPGSLLELELTETALMRDIPRAVEVLSSLRQMGVRLAIDDFGTGYSSLSYLKQFPVQVIKIDQSFVKDIAAGGEAVKIAGAIIALAHGMELEVIAEGVETDAQRGYLTQHGCDQFQGYLFGQPMPAAQASAWLSATTGHHAART